MDISKLILEKHAHSKLDWQHFKTLKYVFTVCFHLQYNLLIEARWCTFKRYFFVKVFNVLAEELFIFLPHWSKYFCKPKKLFTEIFWLRYHLSLVWIFPKYILKLHVDFFSSTFKRLIRILKLELKKNLIHKR